MTIKSIALTLPFVLAGWFATLVAVGLVADKTPAHIVLLPSADFMNNLPPEASILRMNEWSVTLSSSQPGFAIALYEHGATVVLPSGLRGCLNL